MRQTALVSLPHLLYYNHLNLDFTGLQGTAAALINALPWFLLIIANTCVSLQMSSEGPRHFKGPPLLLLQESSLKRA